MNIVGVQLDIVWEDKRANFDRVDALIESADIEPGSLIVLPEMFATGFSMNLAAICDDETRPTERFLRSLATRYRAHALGGLVTPCEDGRGRNQAVGFDPSGRETVRYCKMHPFSYAGESDHFMSGDRPVTFSWSGFTVAPLICYDLRFPEVFRHAIQLGAELFVVIACWPEARQTHWTTLLKARAIENQAYVVAVNRCGKDPTVAYSGRSMIVDPHGEVIADAGDRPGTIGAQLDRAALESYRHDFPALEDIRPEYRKSPGNPLGRAENRT